MKKVIVTGSAGFIGKALVKKLLMMGVEVIGLDLRHEEQIKFFQHPLYVPTDMTEVWRLLDEIDGIDCVFHLAAETSVFNNNVREVIDHNIDRFASVCLRCKEYNVKLVYASSSCAADGNATSIYGLSKKFDEEFARIYNPGATGIRFHNVYGPDPREGTLLWHLLNDEVVKLYNNGRNRRHFTYIDDIVDSLIYASSCNVPLLNVCNPELTSTRQFAELVSQYKPIEFELVADKREFDKEEQNIETTIPVVPLLYTPVEEGIKRIFTKE